MRYYFLAASLPEIQLGKEPELSFDALMVLFRENLTQGDMGKIDRLRWLIDLQNIQRFTLEKPLNPRGSLSRQAIEEALLHRVGLPEYVFDILDEGQNFHKLYLTFFGTEAREEKGFLKRYFSFERAMRLCLTAYRAKKIGRDLKAELKDADNGDFLVKRLLSSQDVTQAEFPFPMRDLWDMLQRLSDQPKEQAFELLKYRFEKIGELAKDAPFSFEALMIYTLRLMLAEEWFFLNEEEGKKRFEEIA